MSEQKEEILERLALKVLQMIGKSSKEIERTCWMVVHEHCNGTMPSEYDIRGIDEDLYLALLSRVKANYSS